MAGKHRRSRALNGRTFLATVLCLAFVGGVSAAACNDGRGSKSTVDKGAKSSVVIDVGDDGDYHPVLDPADFVDHIDNQYLPFKPGSHWVYKGESDGEQERIEITVSAERKKILGIQAIGVHDVNYVDNELTTDTYDWYAQDKDGTVWYLGEDTKEYKKGKVTGTEGSWTAGIDGAQPGIFMLGKLTVGKAYRQQYYPGKAEDRAQIVHIGVNQTIGLGDYHDVIVIKGWTPLEPEMIEEKYYAPGIGKIFEQLTAGGKGGTELVEYVPGN